MTKHTPTPWVVSSYEGGWTCIRECHGGPVLFKLSLNIEDNAERAVACTNAFHSPDGREIPTDKIKLGVVWEMEERIIMREARRLEILDWLQEEIGTAWECDQCGHITYHSTANECADCGAEFPLPNMLAFKLHAAGTENEEFLEQARALLAKLED